MQRFVLNHPWSHIRRPSAMTEVDHVQMLMLRGIRNGARWVQEHVLAQDSGFSLLFLGQIRHLHSGLIMDLKSGNLSRLAALVLSLQANLQVETFWFLILHVKMYWCTGFYDLLAFGSSWLWLLCIVPIRLYISPNETFVNNQNSGWKQTVVESEQDYLTSSFETCYHWRWVMGPLVNRWDAYCCKRLAMIAVH